MHHDVKISGTRIRTMTYGSESECATHYTTVYHSQISDSPMNMTIESNTIMMKQKKTWKKKLLETKRITIIIIMKSNERPQQYSQSMSVTHTESNETSIYLDSITVIH